MKKAIQQEFPPGWNEKKVRELIAYYDNQTDEEGAAEIEAADAAPGETWMAVQSALQHGHRGLPGGATLARLLRAHRRASQRTGTTFPTEDPDGFIPSGTVGLPPRRQPP